MRIAYSYIRFSSLAQAQGNSLRRQLELTQAYCDRNGLLLDDSLRLQDLGVSAYRGTNVKEGALARFVEACKAGKVRRGSVLIVESLDRLSRDQIRPALQLFIAILDAGVSIVTLQPEREYAPDLNDPLVLIEPLIIFSRAHEESAMKSHRARDAWDERRKTGADKPMTGKCPDWLELKDDKFIQIRPAVEAIRRMFELSLEGMGPRRITNTLVREGYKPFGKTGIWKMPYIRKILTWPAVHGEHQPHVLQDGKRVPVGEPIPNYYPAIVSEEDFYKAQQGLKSRKNYPGGRVAKDEGNLFTGLVHHAGDKATMVMKRSPGRQKRYIYLTSGAYLDGRGSVGNQSIPYPPFEQAVLTFLTELQVKDVAPPTESDGAGNKEDELARLTDEVLVLDAKLEKTNKRAQASKDEDFDTFLDLIQGLKEERRKKEEAIERLKIETAVNRAQVLEETRSLVAMLASATGEEAERLRRRVKTRVRSLVREIWVLPEKVGRHRVILTQVYLHSGVVRDIVIYHPALQAGEVRPRLSVPTGTDLRTYAANASTEAE